MEAAPKVGSRVAVRGKTGSGKSTLSRELSGRLSVPHVELDVIFHLANWQEIETEDFRRIVTERVAGEGWVVDGNYRKVNDIVFSRADTVIWLDYSLPLVLLRLGRRTVLRGVTRKELWNGNRESLWRHFATRESLFLWACQTHRKLRNEAEQFLRDPQYAHLIRLHFRHPAETARWLRSL